MKLKGALDWSKRYVMTRGNQGSRPLELLYPVFNINNRMSNITSPEETITLMRKENDVLGIVIINLNPEFNNEA